VSSRSHDRDLLVALDCATEYLALAVADGSGRLLASRTVHLGRQHAARLPTELQALFDSLQRRPDELAGVRVGVGPGSYTGVRVSVSFAKGLARSLAVPLLGVSSLAAVGGPRLAEDESGVALLDARRGNWYAQALRRASSLPGMAPRVSELSEPFKLPLAELAERFAGLRLLDEGPPPDAAFLLTLPGAREATARYL